MTPTSGQLDVNTVLQLGPVHEGYAIGVKSQ